MNNEAIEIIKEMCEEFCQLDLPYGSKAYTKATEYLRNNSPAKTLTDELKALLHSVNGDCYLGKEKEEALVAQVRKQYTEPAKTLTDEEIISIMVQFDVYSSDDHCLIEAGRAILRKASEK